MEELEEEEIRALMTMKSEEDITEGEGRGRGRRWRKEEIDEE